MDAPSLAATCFIEADQPDIHDDTAGHALPRDIRKPAGGLVRGARDAVSDSGWACRLEPDTLTASNVLKLNSACRVSKTLQLPEVARATGVPARVGDADVRPRMEDLTFRDDFDDLPCDLSGADMMRPHSRLPAISGALRADRAAARKEV